MCGVLWGGLGEEVPGRKGGKLTAHRRRNEEADNEYDDEDFPNPLVPSSIAYCEGGKEKKPEKDNQTDEFTKYK